MAESSVTLLVDGAAVRGMLHLPDGAGPFPAVLWLHGFGGSRVEARRLFVDGARRLAARGIASLRIDFRGCGESDGDFADTTIASMVADARAALDELARHEAVDADRLGMVGFSLGATIASQLASAPDVAAMALWSPVVFPVPIFARLGLYAAHPELTRQGWIDGGGLKVGRDFMNELAALDPLGAMSRWNRPLFVLYGQQDMVATTENAEALLEEVPGAEGDCCPHADHAFSTVKSRTWLLEHTENWLAEQLRGGARVSAPSAPRS